MNRSVFEFSGKKQKQNQKKLREFRLFIEPAIFLIDNKQNASQNLMHSLYTIFFYTLK